VLLSGRRFLVESVLALQTELRARKSDLLVRFGEPERVLAGLVGHLREREDADVEVFCQREVRAFCSVLPCGRAG
jgi:deoxyribodipyrimidine photolyase